MTRIRQSSSLTPTYRIGIGGNLYVYCLDFYGVQRVCIRIGKSPKSIRSHPKHRVWYVRIKSSNHKKAFYEHLDKLALQTIC